MQNTIKLKYNRNNSFVATKVFHSITKTATCNSEKFCTPSPLWRGKIVIFFRIRCYFTLSTLLNSINNYPRKYLSPKRYCRTHIEHQSCIQLKHQKYWIPLVFPTLNASKREFFSEYFDIQYAKQNKVLEGDIL